MNKMNTPHGEVEILSNVNGKDLLVEFTATGGKVITTMRKLKNGNVRDPLEIKPMRFREARWEILLASGETFAAYEMNAVAERTGVHVATVRKIAQGTRKHPAIVSITRI